MKMFVPEKRRVWNVIILAVININAIHTATVHESIEENASSPHCRKLSSTSLDCSNLMLKAIPNDIPNTTLTLNLSSNHIKLQDSSFGSCCKNLQELDLSNNDISAISQEFFRNLVNLTRLILRNNSISEFDPETFSDLSKLEQLDLSKNPLILQKGFINHSKLITLNLDDCGLSEIPEGTFSGLKQVEVLTLTKNPFEEDFDSSAFEDLPNLTKLEIKNISRESIKDLCDKLSGIDTINFDGFNISCYIYEANGNFEDAIVGNDPPIEQPLALPRATFPPPKPTTTSSTTEATTESAIKNSTVTKIMTNDHDEKRQRIDVVATTESVDSATVDIDSQTLKYVLIAIIAITLTGILIGLICRADICGIKTKMCRSKKGSNNRREPADTVSPFEEIPLNTVTVNSNGKTVEGQG